MSKPTFIWDLDGTLLDSYEIIVDSLYQIYNEQNIHIEKKYILKEIINDSVATFIKNMENAFGITFVELKDRYSKISFEKLKDIHPMEHAIELLEYLKKKKVNSYILTHRGVTTETVLKRTGLEEYFLEVISSLNGFPRKPDPTGLNNLIKKYKLDRNNTYYVGDRSIDVECANRAHIKSILFISKKSVGTPTGKETYVFHDLLEIKDLV